MGKQYEYDAVIRELPEKGDACVVFPWDIREEFDNCCVNKQDQEP